LGVARVLMVLAAKGQFSFVLTAESMNFPRVISMQMRM
jgi:hypothetical protein